LSELINNANKNKRITIKTDKITNNRNGGERWGVRVTTPH